MVRLTYSSKVRDKHTNVGYMSLTGASGAIIRAGRVLCSEEKRAVGYIKLGVREHANTFARTDVRAMPFAVLLYKPIHTAYLGAQLSVALLARAGMHRLWRLQQVGYSQSTPSLQLTHGVIDTVPGLWSGSKSL